MGHQQQNLKSFHSTKRSHSRQCGWVEKKALYLQSLLTVVANQVIQLPMLTNSTLVSCWNALAPVERSLLLVEMPFCFICELTKILLELKRIRCQSFQHFIQKRHTLSRREEGRGSVGRLLILVFPSQIWMVSPSQVVGISTGIILLEPPNGIDILCKFGAFVILMPGHATNPILDNLRCTPFSHRRNKRY